MNGEKIETASCSNCHKQVNKRALFMFFNISCLTTNASSPYVRSVWNICQYFHKSQNNCGWSIHQKEI